METESFALEMRDQLSGPARDMRANLTALKGGMKSIGSEIDSLAAKQLKYKEAGLSGVAAQVGLEIQKRKLAMKGLGDQLKDTNAKQKEFTDAQKKMREEMTAERAEMAEITAGLSEIARYAGIAALALGGLVVAGAALAIEAGMFRIRMTNVFTQFRGTAAEGQKTYEMVRQMSRTLPIPQEKAFESAQELLSMGLQGTNRLHNTVQAIADMQAVMGDSAASKLRSVIGNAQQSTYGGRFRGVFSIQPAELKEIGLSYDQLTDVLAKKLGRSNAETKQMLMYGRIDAATGIDALNQAIAKGGIGEAAKDALLDPTLLMQQFKSHIKDLFADVDIKPFLRELRNVVNLFDLQNNSGKAMKDGLTGTFNTLLKIGRNMLIGFQIGFLRLEILLLKVAIAAAPMVKEIKRLGENQTLIDTMTWGLTNMGNAIGGVVLGLTAAVAVFALFINSIDALRKADVNAVGQQLMQGLADGITKGASDVLTAIQNVGEDTLKELRKAFDSHSPSRKGMGIGRDLAAGVRIGVGEGGLDLSGGTLAFKALPAAPAASGGSRLSITVAPGAVVIQGAGIGNVEQFAAMLEPALADILERATEEVGFGRD